MNLIFGGQNLFVYFTLFALGGCFTPAKERQIKDDIFSLQSRLTQIEASMSATGKDQQSTQSNANQRIASNITQIERLEMDLQKVRGEMDTLRVGVVTGQMPGSEPDDGSVAKSLSDILARLEVLETNQTEVIAAIREATGKKVKTEKGKEGAGKEISGFSSLKKAFTGKQYTRVADAASGVVEGLKKKDEKEDAYYYWAESLYKLGKLRDAALKFNDFVEMFAKSERVPHAKMRMGDCFRHLGDKATAKLYYEDLVANHPKAPEAGKAKERLTKL